MSARAFAENTSKGRLIMLLAISVRSDIMKHILAYTCGENKSTSFWYCVEIIV